MTSTGESNLNLTREQLEILKFVRKGHNVVITGQAGVGKSRVVRAIREDCSKRNLTVGVICSTGISCTVYESGTASTVHSFYGFGVADLPSALVVTRSVANYSVRERVGNLDVIIGDEASMPSSARMLELVNAVHHCLVEPDSADFMCAFAGKQVIIVGEFSYNCLLYPTEYPTQVSVILQSSLMALTTLDFPTPAYPVITTLCPFLTNSSISNCSRVKFKLLSPVLVIVGFSQAFSR